MKAVLAESIKSNEHHAWFKDFQRHIIKRREQIEKFGHKASKNCNEFIFKKGSK